MPVAVTPAFKSRNGSEDGSKHGRLARISTAPYLPPMELPKTAHDVKKMPRRQRWRKFIPALDTRTANTLAYVAIDYCESFLRRSQVPQASGTNAHIYVSTRPSRRYGSGQFSKPSRARRRPAWSDPRWRCIRFDRKRRAVPSRSPTKCLDRPVD